MKGYEMRNDKIDTEISKYAQKQNNPKHLHKY